MKKIKILNLVTCLGLIFIFSSCNKDELKQYENVVRFGANDEKLKQYGSIVTFGANYHVINCLSAVTVYLDGKNIGTLKNAVDKISDCGMEENITKEISAGKHSYKIEIRPQVNGGCTKDVTGTFVVSKNECKKIFVDY